MLTKSLVRQCANFFELFNIGSVDLEMLDFLDTADDDDEERPPFDDEFNHDNEFDG